MAISVHPSNRQQPLPFNGPEATKENAKVLTVNASIEYRPQTVATQPANEEVPVASASSVLI